MLVVEDDPLIGELLTLRLESSGYRTAWLKDGEAVLNRMADIKPQLMVLDLGLPTVDGFQVLQTLRRNALWRTLPIIVLTARHNAEDVKRALALGATDYVAKPFDAQPLMKRIERHLTKAGSKLPPSW